jgi:hypothetical protein
MVLTGKTMQGHVVTYGPEGTWLPLDSTPPGFPVEKNPPHNPTIAVVAATERYFAFGLMPAGFESLGVKPTEVESVHIHDRRLNTWKELESVSKLPFGRRIFGPWLATIVERKPTGNSDRDFPGEENQRCCEPVLHKGEMRDDLLIRPSVRELYERVASQSFSIPGILILDDLDDGRRITIQTGQEDSEILTIRDDGLVLYRVNDSILAAQIEGNKLGEPSLVVKDEDVPEVHWVFWSPAAAH